MGRRGRGGRALWPPHLRKALVRGPRGPCGGRGRWAAGQLGLGCWPGSGRWPVHPHSGRGRPGVLQEKARFAAVAAEPEVEPRRTDTRGFGNKDETHCVSVVLGGRLATVLPLLPWVPRGIRDHPQRLPLWTLAGLGCPERRESGTQRRGVGAGQRRQGPAGGQAHQVPPRMPPGAW